MVNVRGKSESKGQQILVAATELFTEHGYSSTSMDLVAKQAGVSKQTVYSHFGNKDQLFAESIKSKCDSYQVIDYALTKTAKPEEILFVLAQRFLAMITSRESLAVHKVCAYESKSHPQLSELFYQGGPQRLIAEVTQLMEKFDNEQQLNISNAKFAALQFLNMVKGETWMRVEFNTKEQVPATEVEAYLKATIAMFLKGYSI